MKIWIAITCLISLAAFAKSDKLELRYYVSGMSCGSCVSNIKHALLALPELKDQIVEVKVGELNLQLAAEKFDSSKVNCQISNAIQSQTSYKLYMDKEMKKLACNDK